MERGLMELEKKGMEQRLQDRIDYLTRQVECKDMKIQSMSATIEDKEEDDVIATERKAMEEELEMSEMKAMENKLDNVTKESEKQKAIGLEKKVVEDRLKDVTSKFEAEAMKRKTTEERLEKVSIEAEKARKTAKIKEERMQDSINNLTREIQSKEKNILSRSAAFEKKMAAMELTEKALEKRLEKVTNDLDETRRIANRRLSVHTRVTSRQVAKF